MTAEQTVQDQIEPMSSEQLARLEEDQAAMEAHVASVFKAYGLDMGESQ
jgi:hypothetical protein